MAAADNIERVGSLGADENGDLKALRPEKIKIVDLTSFKSSKELFSTAKPFISILPKGAKSKL